MFSCFVSDPTKGERPAPAQPTAGLGGGIDTDRNVDVAEADVDSLNAGGFFARYGREANGPRPTAIPPHTTGGMVSIPSKVTAHRLTLPPQLLLLASSCRTPSRPRKARVALEYNKIRRQEGGDGLFGPTQIWNNSPKKE